MSKSQLAGAALIALFWLAAPLAASAQEEANEEGGFTPNVYVGLSTGGALEDFESDNTRMNFSDSLTVSAWLGMRPVERVGWELQVEYASGFDTNAAGNALELSTLTPTFNLKGYLFTGTIEPFLLGGFGPMVTRAESNRTRTLVGIAGRLGAGVDWWLTERFAAHFDTSYVLTDADTRDRNYVSLSAGLQFRF